MRLTALLVSGSMESMAAWPRMGLTMDIAEKERQKKAMPVSPGRPKGVPNKTTQLLKDAILKAAEQAGNKVGDDGMVSYLEVQATENPGPFMSLLGKVLPMQVTGAGGGPILSVTRIELVSPDDDG
jgi:hypothetical protein